MVKKQIRSVIASADQAAIIDRGDRVKTELDNLTYEDKAIKGKIGQFAQEMLSKDETNIQLEGRTAIATVTQTEKMSVKANVEMFPILQDALSKGFLRAVVTITKNLVIPPDDIARAAEALKKAGITVSVVESLSVKSEDVRAMRQSEVSSVEETKARQALEACLEAEVSYRVKYDTKG